MRSFVQDLLNGLGVFRLEVCRSVPKPVEFVCPPEVDERQEKGKVDPCLEPELHDMAPLGSAEVGSEQGDAEPEGVEQERREHPGEGQVRPKQMLTTIQDEVDEGLQVCSNVHPVEDDVEEDIHENLPHLGVRSLSCVLSPMSAPVDCG